MAIINGIDPAPYVSAHHAGIEAFDRAHALITSRDVALDFDNVLHEAAHAARRRAAEALDIEGAVAEFRSVLEGFRSQL